MASAISINDYGADLTPPKPLVLVIGRLMLTAPELFGETLDQASPDLEPILRFFRAADIDSDWNLSVVEFHTLLTVVMKDS